jgi:hypothetical protein
MNHLKKNPLFYLSIALVGIVSLQFYSIVSAQWSQPAGAPPASSVNAPLDTGSEYQLKKGSLYISAEGNTSGTGLDNYGIILSTAAGQPASLVFDTSAGFAKLSFLPDNNNHLSLYDRFGPVSIDALGLIMPNVASSSIANPEEGMVIYSTSSKILQVYDGTNWNSVGGGGGGSYSSIFQDAVGNIGINTKSPQTTLSVQGSLSLLRVPGDLPGGPGPQLTLQSPSSGDVSTQVVGNITQCVLGSTCPADTTPTHDTNTTYTCLASDVGKADMVDVGPWGGTGTFYGTIHCTGGTSSYTLQVNNGTLQFMNKSGVSKMTLDQDGKLSVSQIILNSGIYPELNNSMRINGLDRRVKIDYVREADRAYFKFTADACSEGTCTNAGDGPFYTNVWRWSKMSSNMLVQLSYCTYRFRGMLGPAPGYCPTPSYIAIASNLLLNINTTSYTVYDSGNAFDPENGTGDYNFAWNFKPTLWSSYE